ncbi:hypothetical protein A2U01_0088675, partial [Trifolium medium]|nr:hypothetical protein [Trifolium medium]
PPILKGKTYLVLLDFLPQILKGKTYLTTLYSVDSCVILPSWMWAYHMEDPLAIERVE